MDGGIRRMAEMHVEQAREAALRLVCYSSTIMPDEFRPQVTELVFKDLTSFAIHARRVNELCGFRKAPFDVSALRYNIDEATIDPPLETDYHEGLNRLIHATGYDMGYTRWSGTAVYTKSVDYILSFVSVNTDRKPKASVSIFGLAFCFLTQVMIQIKTDHPDLQF